MKKKIIPNNRSVGFHILRFDKNEEVIETLTQYCVDHGISLGTVSAIGAAKEITVGYFDTAQKEYHSKQFSGDLEMTAITGNVSTMNGEIYLHLHVNFSDEECNGKGGHLNRAVVSGTCEMFITEIDDTVDRAFSDEIGLNLFRF